MGQQSSTEASAAAPLVFTYQLVEAASIVTTVTGDARQYARVQIVIASITVWSGTLSPYAPVMTLDHSVVYDGITFAAGGTFALAAPTPVQLGSVKFIGTVATPATPGGMSFSVPVAVWTLTSTD